MNETCSILLVEDDDDDRLLFEAALKNSHFPSALSHARNVPEAKAILEGATELPRFIVCDLWLGAENGIDFLHWLRASANFKLVPFILIVTSISPEILNEVYDAGVNSCFLKGRDMRQWDDTIKTLLTWWCAYATAPKIPNVKTPNGWKGVPS